MQRRWRPLSSADARAPLRTPRSSSIRGRSAGSRSLLLRLVRRFDRERTANLTAGIMRRIGPLAARAQDRPRQSRRRLSGEVAGRDRDASSPACGTISAGSRRNSRISTGLRFATPDDPRRRDIDLRPGVAAALQRHPRRRQAARCCSRRIWRTGKCRRLPRHRCGLDTSVLYRAAQYPRGQRSGAGDPRRLHGHAGADRASPRRCSSAARSNAAARRHAGRPA